MLLRALLSLLVAAPASAAVRPASCLQAASFDEFRRCQDKTHAAAVAAAASQDAPLTEAQLETLDERQRTEARKFLARPGLAASGSQDAEFGPASKKSSKGKLGGATAADLKRLDAKSSAAVKGLQDRMQAAAGDGKAGITPSMADDARATLTQAQGSISPDMQDLLNGVQKDGGTLTSGTMKKLQGAGKAAKAEGLDLNIDPAVEKQLLNGDFNKEKPADDPSALGM